MNAASCCHTIEGCPGLYVDAFRGALLRKTNDADNSFILTHYHGVRSILVDNDIVLLIYSFVFVP